MSDQNESVVHIAPPGTVIHKSELFPVIIRGKQIEKGVLRDRYVVNVEILENDPTVTRTALLEIPEDVYKSLSVGEKVEARLYQHDDNTWQPRPKASF